MLKQQIQQHSTAVQQAQQHLGECALHEAHLNGEIKGLELVITSVAGANGHTEE